MTKSEIHRMLQNPVFTGDFRLARQDLPRVPRAAYLASVLRAGQRRAAALAKKQRHPFMGLLTCARCGCRMTAEIKKGRYIYYRCTGFKGRCGNTYIRQESLAQLLATTVDAIQIPTHIVNSLEQALRTSQSVAETERRDTQARLDPAAPRRCH